MSVYRTIGPLVNYVTRLHRLRMSLNYLPVNSIQLFHACLVNSQNYATRCRGQLNALLPEAARLRAIVHLAVHGTEGHSFDYSAKQA